VSEPVTTTTFNDVLHSEAVSDAVDELLSGAHPSKRPNRIRTRGPGKGKRAECILLLDIAIQALQTAREAAVKVTSDMPAHERARLLVPVLSDAGLAMRSVEEAVERWEAGKV
jgi:hypothetical protein